MTRAEQLLQKIEEANVVPVTRASLRRLGYKQHPTNKETWIHPRTGDTKTVGLMRLR